MHLEGINALLDYFGMWGGCLSHSRGRLHDCGGCLAVAKDLTPRGSIIPASRIWRPRNVLQCLPRHAWQLGDVHRDQECLVAGQPSPIVCLRVRYRSHSCRAHQQSSRQLMTQQRHRRVNIAVPHTEPILGNNVVG